MPYPLIPSHLSLHQISQPRTFSHKNPLLTPHISELGWRGGGEARRGWEKTKLSLLLQVPLILQSLLIKWRPHLPKGTIPARTTSSVSLPLSAEPIWALFDLYFSYDTMAIKKEKWNFWQRMAMIFFKPWRKLVKMISFWNCKTGSFCMWN